MTIAEHVQRRDRNVFPYIKKRGGLSLEIIGDALNLSKYSVCRSIQAIKKEITILNHISGKLRKGESGWSACL